MKVLIACVLFSSLLSGCAILAGGIIGGAVVAHHEQWCQWHPYECRYGHRHH